jgi:hypothetical protein
MRPLRPGFALLLLALGLGGAAGARGEFSLFQNVWGDVLVATDTTEEGRKLPQASKEQPVYYKGLSMGNLLGEGLRGDQEPGVKELNNFVASVLAKQGYLPARPGKHEPTLLLVLQWGYLDPRTEDLFWFLGYNTRDDIAAPTQINFLGAEVFRRGMRSRTTETILRDAQNPIYGIMISAFDYKTAKTLEPVILWQTRIGLPTNGKSMVEAMPVMLVAAGPAIGRPADKPVLADADAARSGTVNLGELQFLDSFYDPARGPGVGAKK